MTVTKKEAIEEVLELKEFAEWMTNALGPANRDKMVHRLDVIQRYIKNA